MGAVGAERSGQAHGCADDDRRLLRKTRDDVTLSAAFRTSGTIV